jgi:hypothetical protein
MQSECPAQYNGTRSFTARACAGVLIKPRIHSLPLEILSAIFVLSLASDKKIVECSPSWTQRNPPPPWRGPLTLCAVSLLWRSIALATPQLWQQVFVHVPCSDMPRVMAKSKAQELIPWIERSGSLPLTLFIRQSTISFQELDAIIEVLDCYASRWETLCFENEGNSNLLDFVRRPDKWSSLRRMYGVRSCNTIITNGHNLRIYTFAILCILRKRWTFLKDAQDLYGSH